MFQRSSEYQGSFQVANDKMGATYPAPDKSDPAKQAAGIRTFGIGRISVNIPLKTRNYYRVLLTY